MAGEHLKMVLCLSLPVLPAAGPPFSALYLGPGSAFQATTCCLVLVLVDLVCCCVIVFFFFNMDPGAPTQTLILAHEAVCCHLLGVSLSLPPVTLKPIFNISISPCVNISVFISKT